MALEAFDLAPVLAARYDTSPGGEAEVDAIGRELLDVLDGIEVAS